ncbi:hypothetical protein PtrSN002B_002765 [Pyrenophora tritici-repentis]|uniref:Uncharacterized protein n=1 Tax=Pyrenophora tritici-repentis TaxID=45151 RepID=A0A5M9LA30_9PLEO|nr:hypothetical protein PtrV1_07166 [Pyrenophora tritici-repentis]KAF7571936.1 hypothetical protein PtrM4_094360 [Pyrenophora tritici-repentis]KAI1517175.1 hypothetical protein Ptr86124_004112 [Pyrenophora tritici-repentis]KAI1555724.1 hypothetical protein PtrSN002B_002765 [Pyrenophora tritici-repentis]KAI1670275.1 hypothetical protein L13192_05791 [Pyrenophora tritici-repentis]
MAVAFIPSDPATDRKPPLVPRKFVGSVHILCGGLVAHSGGISDGGANAGQRRVDRAACAGNTA